MVGLQVMDPSIADVPVTEIGTFSEIAAACCQHDPLRRPRMREVRTSDLRESVLAAFR